MILLLDNHDSFVHNLARYFRRAGASTRVVRSDTVDAAWCAAQSPRGIVLSPGPKHPRDAGCCVEVVRRLSSTVPILGVCLGHQAIGHAFAARIATVPPVHGRASRICHHGDELFEGCPMTMSVGRYHSLAVDAVGLPEQLQVTATTCGEDGPALVMSLRHRWRPLFGVQFHPESILTEGGQRLVENFVALTCRWDHGVSSPQHVTSRSAPVP